LKIFNISLVYILCVIFLASTMFYGLIVQEDMRNKGQTLFGILTFSVFLLIVVIHYESKDYYVRKIHAKITPSRSRTDTDSTSISENSGVSIRTRNFVESGTSMMRRLDPTAQMFDTVSFASEEELLADPVQAGFVVGLHNFLWKWTFPGVFLVCEAILRYCMIFKLF